MIYTFAVRKNFSGIWTEQHRKKRMIWLEIRESKYLLRKGLQENGLFARRAFQKNSTIGVFRGERMTEKQADLRLDTKWQIKLASGDVVVDMIASDCKLKFVNLLIICTKFFYSDIEVGWHIVFQPVMYTCP